MTSAILLYIHIRIHTHINTHIYVSIQAYVTVPGFVFLTRLVSNYRTSTIESFTRVMVTLCINIHDPCAVGFYVFEYRRSLEKRSIDRLPMFTTSSVQYAYMSNMIKQIYEYIIHVSSV